MLRNDLTVLTLAALSVCLVSMPCLDQRATAADPSGITSAEVAEVPGIDRPVEESDLKPERKRIWQRKLDDGTSLVVDEHGDQWGPLDYTWRTVTDAKQDESPLFSCVATNGCVVSIPRELFPVTVLDAGLTPHGDLMTVYNQRGKCWGVIVTKRPGSEEMPARFDFSPVEKQKVGYMVGPPLRSAKMELNSNGVFRITGEDEDGTSVQYELRHWTYFQRIVYFWKPIHEADGK